MGKLKVELKVTLKRSLVMPVVARYDTLGPGGYTCALHARRLLGIVWRRGGKEGGSHGVGEGGSGLKHQYVTSQIKTYLFRMCHIARCLYPCSIPVPIYHRSKAPQSGLHYLPPPPWRRAKTANPKPCMRTTYNPKPSSLQKYMIL